MRFLVNFVVLVFLCFSSLAYEYFPTFKSDALNGDIPYSLYKGPRTYDPDMLRKQIVDSDPRIRIAMQIESSELKIVPVGNQKGRYLHLKMLNNSNPKQSNRCHFNEIYLADSQGRVLSRDGYTFSDKGNCEDHFPKDIPEHILDGDLSTVWQAAVASCFPYQLTIDCGAEQQAAFVVFVHRSPKHQDTFFNQFEFELSENKIRPNSMRLFSTKAGQFDLEKEKQLKGVRPVSLPDAAGTISLRHYHATKPKDGYFAWRFVAEKGTTYRVFSRSKIKGKPVQGSIVFDRKTVPLTDETVLKINSNGYQDIAFKSGEGPANDFLAFELVDTDSLPFFEKLDTSVNLIRPPVDKIHPEIIRKMETLANGNYDLRTKVPSLIEKGRAGYVIITTEEKRRALASLDAFVRHKQSRGFDVHVITENQFGGGEGVTAALRIRDWLQKNHKELNLLYVLMLGNPHPVEGDVPYMKVGKGATKPEPCSPASCSGNAVEGRFPTDYFYVDLSGDWDLNGNGVFADGEDYGPGGIDGQPEVYVGRIPYYGVDVPFLNACEVDAILERVIRYENDASPLMWRQNVFCAGDLFSRALTMYKEAFCHNGAELKRFTHTGAVLPFEPDRESCRQVECLEAQNSGSFGTVFYQEHASPYSIGGIMSSSGASQLLDHHPSFYYLGGCSVASPEHPNNVCHALLRSNAIGVLGGTRAVSVFSSNKWLKHGLQYSYSVFGMSNGEALWTRRAMQSKGRTIAGTNFLINLLGDPSVVLIPNSPYDPICVSPGFDIRLAAVQGTKRLEPISYEIWNTMDRKAQLEIKGSKGLEISKTQLNLAPGAYEKVQVSVPSVGLIPTGEYEIPICVKQGSKKIERKIVLEVRPKKLVYHNNCNSPLPFRDAKRKPITPPASEALAQGKFGRGANIAQTEVSIRTPKWGERESYTISFFQKIITPGNYDVLRAGPVSVLLNKGRVGVWKRPTPRFDGVSPPTKIYDGPSYKLNEWQHIVVAYDRAELTLSISVDGTVEKHKLPYDGSVRFTSRNITLLPQGKNSNYHLDELSVLNYAVDISDVAALAQNQFSAPTSPPDGCRVHPRNVILSWENFSNNKVNVQVALDPNFKRVVFERKARNGMRMGELKDQTRYYWRVNHSIASQSNSTGLVRSFRTDSSVVPLKITLSEIELPKAKVGVAGYNQNLARFVSGISATEKRKLTFSKVSGPNWLRIFDDGKLFTNYGPAIGDVGENKFRVLITASDGTIKSVDFSVTVVQ